MGGRGGGKKEGRGERRRGTGEGWEGGKENEGWWGKE